MATATRPQESTANGPRLLLAFELGARKWVLGFTTDLATQPRKREVSAGDMTRVLCEIAAAKAAFGLPPAAVVYSCYEAGREGFWLHRWLEAQHLVSFVVDSSSIEVPRRLRRAKTDKLDAAGLLRLLARYLLGEKKAWSVVRVPSVAAEDARQLEREVETTTADRTRVRNRIRGLLAAQGISLPFNRHLRAGLAVVRTGAGDPLPTMLRARLEREWTALADIELRLRELRAIQRKTVTANSACARLEALRGIGLTSAARLSREVFDWRHFTSGRQVGALLGMTPTPYNSGDDIREQGISKAGNRRVRVLGIELARCWRHFQPESALTKWYQRRFGQGPARLRRIGLVALARKLLIALWRYLETEIVPDGAELKPCATR
jgi:transposase